MSTIMSLAAAKRIVESTLTGAGLPAPFADVISIPLRQRGRILSDTDATQWYSLVDAICKATSGNQRAVPRVVASIEVMVAAVDALDEIEDGDRSPLSDLVGVPRAIHAATTLLALSHLILNDDELLSWDAKVVGKLTKTLSEGMVRASVGQEYDLQASDRCAATVDDAFRIAQLKSGSIVATACRMGALLGTEDFQILSACDEFGVHFGTMAQIANDMNDALDSSDKTDLQLEKPTLPIAYSRGVRPTRGDGTARDGELGEGAIPFAWVVFETERMRCFRSIERLAELGCESSHLMPLMGE